MPKENIHPKWFDEAKVYYDGQLSYMSIFGQEIILFIQGLNE